MGYDVGLSGGLDNKYEIIKRRRRELEENKRRH